MRVTQRDGPQLSTGSRRTGKAGLAAMLTLTCAAVIATSCSTASPTVVDGRAVSMRFDPNRVAGLPASDGPSGPLVPEPSAVGRVGNTDDGHIDRSALLAIKDIEEFWQTNYPPSLPGDFAAVSELMSVDPDEPRPKVCGEDPEMFAFNAAYCRRQNVIVWDRVELLPVAEKYFGDLSINALLAHEYGHAIQNASGLVNEDTDVLVREQQADCFTGMYLRWVAEGSSPRFAMNTTDALDRVLAGTIAIRDRPPDFTLFGLLPGEATHGTALDRVSAFQQGFDLGADSCVTIDADEIQERRGDDIPAALFDPASPHSDMAITEQTLSVLIAVLNDTFAPARPPTLRTGGSSCGSGPALYCANTNTIDVDLAGLEQLGTPASESQRVLLQGDNSAISAVASRYMLAVQNERELAIDGPTAAMRTACLTGVAQSKLADPAVSDDQLVLGAGDLDEAVSGLLTNGIAASDAQGLAVPSGFTRILAFRLGLSSDVERCFRQFR